MHVDGRSLLRSQGSLFGIGDRPIGLDEYQAFTTRTDRNGKTGADGLGFVLLVGPPLRRRRHHRPNCRSKREVMKRPGCSCGKDHIGGQRQICDCGYSSLR